MEFLKDKKRIKDLIAAGKTGQAIAEAKKLYEHSDPEMLKEIILLSNQLERETQNKRHGTQRDNIELNRITSALIEILSKEDENKKSLKYRKERVLLLILLLLNVLSILFLLNGELYSSFPKANLIYIIVPTFFISIGIISGILWQKKMLQVSKLELLPVNQRRQYLENKEREFKIIPTKDLAKKQRYSLVAEIIKNKAKRFKIISFAFIIISLAILLLSTTLFIINHDEKPTVDFILSDEE